MLLKNGHIVKRSDDGRFFQILRRDKLSAKFTLDEITDGSKTSLNANESTGFIQAKKLDTADNIIRVITGIGLNADVTLNINQPGGAPRLGTGAFPQGEINLDNSPQGNPRNIQLWIVYGKAPHFNIVNNTAVTGMLPDFEVTGYTYRVRQITDKTQLEQLRNRKVLFTTIDIGGLYQV